MSENIRSAVINGIKRKNEMGDSFDIDSVDHDESLIELGILDSLAYVNLVLELEAETNASVSLADIDPFEHTSVNGLITFFS